MNVPLEAIFVKRLVLLARSTNFDLDEDTLALYVDNLTPVGLEDCITAVDRILVNRDTRDPFPSVAAIRNAAQSELSSTDITQEITSKIIDCFQRRGQWWPSLTEFKDNIDKFHVALKKEVGQFAFEVIGKRGGYPILVSEWGQAENTGTFRAQLRDSIKSYLAIKQTNDATLRLGPVEKRVEILAIESQK